MVLFILVLIFTFVTGLFLPWWALIPIVFLLCLWKSQNAKLAFLIPFLAVFLLWLVLNFYYSINNDHILTKRVAELFGLGTSSISWLWIIILGPLSGAINAGLAGITGNLTKQLLFKK